MEFFAGANTRNGFVSLFDECFKNIKRLYILKGSSGCGKSTLMRRVAGRAQKAGLPVDLIYCSADSDSLDGVILPTLDIAVADGTAPHIMDVKYPCVRETIINLGQFWDEKKLIPKRDEIIALTDKKSGHYKNAYRCLSASGSVSDMKKQLLSRALLRDKLDLIVLRLAERASAEKGERKTLFATAFTSSGIKALPVFDRVKTLYRVNGNLSDFFMTALAQSVAEKGYQCTVSLSAFDGKIPDAVYFNESKTLVTSQERPICSYADEEKVISSSRFTDNSALASVRAKVRTLDRIANELFKEAMNELAQAKAAHNEIESIYIPAMDFKMLDEYTADLIKGIFGE